MSPVNAPIVFGLVLVLAFFCGVVLFLTEYDTGKCEMTFMYEYPQFVRIANDADVKYKKYGLYAYSEGRQTEKARAMQFDGIPVLFLPGSGGSHKQCRSFASIALRKALNGRARFHFDYFTLDLNNELSGLNGALLGEQYAYALAAIDRILQLYPQQPAGGLVLIGHSMGGVLAKAIVNHLPADSRLAPIVITMSAPLARPVLALDYFFPRFYAAMHQRTHPKGTTFVSLAGGFNDFLVPPHLTDDGGSDLHAVVTHVPKSWVSTDHLSIVWCKQLVLAVNRALFDAVDARTMQIDTNTTRVLDAFRHHLVRHSGTPLAERARYERAVELPAAGDWEEAPYRAFSARLPKGTREARWYLLPIVMQPQYEHLTLVALNFKHADWVYACAAVVMRNNQRSCATALHLSHLAEISPSVRHKRRTLRVNMHDLKMNHTSVTHVAVRVGATSEPTAFHVDITEPAARELVFHGAWWRAQEVLRETEEKAVDYNIRVPQLTQLVHSHTLYLESTCSGQGHHATASLRVPWNHHDMHHFYTDALKEPMVFRLYKPRPAASTDHATIRLTLDPTCRYRISMRSDYALGQLVRVYAPLLVAHFAAVVLFTLRHQLATIARTERCSFFTTSLKEAAKPYYAVTLVKILSRVLCVPLPIVGAADQQLLVDENIDMLLLPALLYCTSVGLLWLFAVTLAGSLVCFESTFHRLGVKFLARTFRGRAGWTDHLAKAFDKIPGIIACVLVAMSYTTCASLAVCLAAIFYFLKLAQMAQELVEGIVKSCAKSVAMKLRDRVWDRVRRWWRAYRQPSVVDEQQHPQLPIVGDGEEEKDATLPPDELERPMEFEIPQAGDPNRVARVDGERLLDMLGARMNEAPAESLFAGFNVGWIREAIENNEIFFHFTMFIIYLLVAMLNVPTVLTWARNYKYSKALTPDPLFLPGLVLSLCAAPLWQMDFPRVDRMYFRHTALVVYAAGLMVLIYGVVSIYRISFVLAAVVAIVTGHQLFAPVKPDEDEGGNEPHPGPSVEDMENDSFSERVRAKWE